MPTSIGVGQIYNVNLRDYLGSAYDPWFNGVADRTLTFNYKPDWLFIQGAERVDPLNDATYRITDGHLTLVGTAPEVVGTHPLGISWYDGDTGRNDLFVYWEIDVTPPTPYSVTLISDPMPTSISTSAGTVTLTNGVGTILGGTVMHEPDLQRERHILHRWTDAAGNTYDWSKPVTSDLTLTADWREHFSVSVQGNKATVTLSPDLPTEYATHRIDWGDNTIDDNAVSGASHLYAATGDYTITVRSGQYGNQASSSTTVAVETVTTVTYTVTFDSAGGSAVPSQTVQEGGKATAPAAPTRQGYNFTGWYLSGKLYDFNTPVTGDLYLSAGWTAAPPGDDQNGEDEPENNLLFILLTALTVISLAITLFTRSPYAFALTVVLALIELALLTGALAGVIA